MHPRWWRTRSRWVRLAWLTSALLSLFSNPVFSSPGVLTSQDLLQPGTCINFRSLLQAATRSLDPAQVAKVVYRALVNRAEGELPIPNTLLVDHPDKARGALGDTPLLISFPRQKAVELRAVLVVDPKTALEHPQDIPYLRELLEQEYPRGDQLIFPDRETLIRDLGAAHEELRLCQDEVSAAQAGQGSDALVQRMDQAEDRASRLQMLVALRDFYGAVSVELKKLHASEELHAKIGKLSTVLSSVLRELVVPIGRHPDLMSLEGDTEFAPTRALWLQEFERFNATLPEGMRYDPARSKKVELGKANRILSFMREIARFPDDASTWDVKEKRRRLWGVIRWTQFGQHVVSDSPWLSLEQINALEAEQILSPGQATAFRSIATVGSSIAERIEGLTDTLRHQRETHALKTEILSTERELKHLQSLWALRNHIFMFEHLSAQGFPAPKHLEVCRKLVVYENQAAGRWRDKDKENIGRLKFITQGYVDQFLGEASGRGLQPQADTWEAREAVLSRYTGVLEAEFRYRFPELVQQDFLQWAMLLKPEELTLPHSSDWDKLIMLSARPADLLRGAMLNLHPEQSGHPHAQIFLEWGTFLNKLLLYKRAVLSHVDDEAALRQLDEELMRAGVTRETLLVAIRGFYPVEEIATQIPERPTDMVAALVTQTTLLPRIISVLAEFLREDVTSTDATMRQISRAVMTARGLTQAKSHLEKLKLVKTMHQLSVAFHELEQVQQNLAAQPAADASQSVFQSEVVRAAAQPVVNWYMHRAFAKQHPAMVMPSGTHTVVVWLHGMGTSRSTVKTLDSAVDLTPSFGKGLYGVGISAPWHGGPNLPLGPGGIPNRDTLRLALQHIHDTVMFYKERGKKVVVAGRSLNASLLMQFLVDNPGVLDGAIAYGGVLPPGYPRGAPKDQIAVNELNALSDEALRARQNETLSAIAVGLLRVTDWYERLETNPRLLDPTPTWVLWGRRDQEYKGILDEVLAEHFLLQRRGVRIVPMLFDEGAHQSFNPRTEPTEAERQAPGFRINDYNRAFPAIAAVARLYLEDPQAFTWELVRGAVLSPQELDPTHMPSELQMRPR